MHIYHVRLLVYFWFTTMLIFATWCNWWDFYWCWIKFCLSLSLSLNLSLSHYSNISLNSLTSVTFNQVNVRIPFIHMDPGIEIEVSFRTLTLWMCLHNVSTKQSTWQQIPSRCFIFNSINNVVASKTTVVAPPLKTQTFRVGCFLIIMLMCDYCLTKDVLGRHGFR